MAIAAVLSFVASVAGIPVRATYGARTTADEPHYLITAISLAEDRNLDVSDEIEQKRYLPFHEIGLNPQAQPFEDGKLVSPHDPLLPAFLAFAFALGGGWVAAKLLLCLVAAALAALTVWVAVKRIGANEGAACAAASIFGMTVPLGVYGNQVYPEIVAALVTLIGVAAMTGSTGSSRRAVWITGMAIVALPWLSIKYAPVSLAIFAVTGIRMWRSDEKRTLALFTAGLAAAGAFFVLTHLWWYGGVTPYAAGDHFVETGEFSVVGTNWNPLGRARRLVGLLIDDKFGLAAWQPAWLLAVPALAGFAAAKRREPYLRAAFLAPFAAAWLNATFIALTMQGFWFPGRQVVVVLPLLVVLVAAWASARTRMNALYAYGGLGVLSLTWLIVEGSQKRITWVVDFYDTRNGFYRLWQSILPDYLDVSPMTWVLQTAWVVALGWWGIATYRKEKSRAAAALDHG